MAQRLAQISLLVRDYDEAIAFYTEKLGFVLFEDTALEGDKRWVRVGPEKGDCTLLLAKASSSGQHDCVGDQTGGRVFLFLETNCFWDDYEAFRARGVSFLQEPREESYGTVAVFVDLYGNKWDLIQSEEPSRV